MTQLLRHPDTPGAVPKLLQVRIARPLPRRLSVEFRAEGGAGQIALPPRIAPQRTDGLWRHSCFELFVKPAGQAGYHEFNLSPHGAWAAYSFTGYREGMADIEPFAAPRIASDWRVPEHGAANLGERDVRAGNDEHLWVRAELDLAETLPVDVPWRIGLCAVIEEIGGSKSYWALAHAPGKPDFHHDACFALELPAAKAA